MYEQLIAVRLLSHMNSCGPGLSLTHHIQIFDSIFSEDHLSEEKQKLDRKDFLVQLSVDLLSDKITLGSIRRSDWSAEGNSFTQIRAWIHSAPLYGGSV